MWISVRARRMTVSPRMRSAIERHLRRMLQRDHPRIASVVVYLTSTRVGRDELEYAARIVIWSSLLGQIAVNGCGPSIRTAVTGATRRARQIVRQRAKKKVVEGRRAQLLFDA